MKVAEKKAWIGRRYIIQSKFIQKFRNEKFLHILILPTIIYFIVFSYIPMYGILVAFKDFSFAKGIAGSPWVGFEYFEAFFRSMYFMRLIKNTMLISFYSILWGMPFPILFALLLNEVGNRQFKRVAQTVSYFPHFVSVVIVVGMMVTFLSPVDGIINILALKLGFEPINFMQESKWFRTLYIGTGIWQDFGWNSILYLAALTSIPMEQYESSKVDGANRFQQAIHITIPGIMPTIIILFILSIGKVMNVGSTKVLLMYSPAIYDVADVISTYVYRKSILGGEMSFGTAVSLFNMAINFILVFITNKISKKVSEVSLW
jgi:putative aldouronate transport system permease protein